MESTKYRECFDVVVENIIEWKFHVSQKANKIIPIVETWLNRLIAIYYTSPFLYINIVNLEILNEFGCTYWIKIDALKATPSWLRNSTVIPI